MSPLAVTGAVATLLWSYAGVCFIAWVRQLSRTGHRLRAGRVIDLVANLVPAVVTLVVVLLAGALIGLPAVVGIIAVLFPAALAFGLHMSLNEIRVGQGTTWQDELARLGLAFAVGAAVIWWRQSA